MAREHARLLVSIWSDPEFIGLSSAEQITYLRMISHHDLSWCGVLPLLPQRLASASRDLTVRRVESAMGVLEGLRFIVSDPLTGEVCVRSFIRHDKVIRQPNVAKAMVRALGLVHSQPIIEVIKTEAARFYLEEPDAKGWSSVESVAPDLFADIIGKAHANPSRKGSEK